MRAACSICKGRTTYYSVYDRFGCETCDSWTEPDHCIGKECDSGFEHAPEKPSLVSRIIKKEVFHSD